MRGSARLGSFKTLKLLNTAKPMPGHFKVTNKTTTFQVAYISLHTTLDPTNRPPLSHKQNMF